MKFFLMICTLLPLAVIASSFSTVDDLEQLSDLEVNLFAGALSMIDDESIECVKNALTQILDENKDLKWWFKDVKKSVLELVDTAKGCLAGEEETKCLKSLKLKAELTLRRLLKAVPKEKKEMFNTLKEYVMKCF